MLMLVSTWRIKRLNIYLNATKFILGFSSTGSNQNIIHVPFCNQRPNEYLENINIPMSKYLLCPKSQSIHNLVKFFFLNEQKLNVVLWVLE